MIEVINVSKYFGNKVLFEDYNLMVNQGEFIIISGESGSGKTTLLNMIGALEKVDSGIIRVDGMNINEKKNQIKYYSETVGFLFQNFVLIEEKTVFDNLNIINKKNRTEITIENALTRVGLNDKINNKIYALSGGEQQRIALARLMLKKCSVILADEPTGSLDKKNAEIVMKILKELNEEGKTILVVTHSDDLKKKGDRLIKI